MWQTVKRLLSDHFGEAEIHDKTELTGGDIHCSWSIKYGEQHIFIKSNTKEMLPVFKAEAEQLELLDRSKTTRVPTVYGVGYDRDTSCLLLEYLPLKPFNAHSAYCFGQYLARLHQWGEQPKFGFDFDNMLATTIQPNGWQKRWNHFYAEKRIGWQLQLAADKGIRFGDINLIVQKISDKLHSHQPQPSLLHGDLWPQNCASLGDDCAVTFDPACYWGDRECDLAMLPLYPELPMQIFDGYQSVWPLPNGFLERQPIYQLYYLINRCHLFGGDHFTKAQNAINKILSN
ncbi:fructosamine kinase family protein [Xenorhabdus szentirmaii]|uniref:Fructosamine kinase family protein n=1 Tax=Xenorhabdus szentirmaii TaxID=290112 RepID=A0AAW3Z127_9GAMM|nr:MULTISPECIES: fructosamine kinase family protein [unclassified Xenorhabdus]MBD2779754.1 fructosamine kinase family protein [Xenorhabdus sp. 38]MBD2793428.1 fructosamine kinase family protein [Xenorhabdus sp. CUL]MBD2802712.1 fructosamine kinase family protein [Xenorhabdus sp. M]